MTSPSPAMPATVAVLFRPLQHELSDIHFKWSLFRQLFGTNPERIDLLNRFARVFFGYTQIIFRDDLILSLFRFTDPASTGKNCNLTLDSLAAAVTTDDAAFGATIQAGSAAIDALLAPWAAWRDKRVAHNDLAHAQARWAGTSLSGPSREQVETILRKMRELMNGVAIHYGEAPTFYEVFSMIPTPGDAEALVYHLEELARRQGAE